MALGSKNRKTEKYNCFYCVDSYANGISFGEIKLKEGQDYRDSYFLQMHETAELTKLRSRYALNKKNPLHELELNLMRLSNSGELASSTICLGTMSDPFLPFEGKFHATLKFLELFNKYKPGLLIVQTRSPLIVLAMPVLRKLGKHVSVTIGLETHDAKVANRYTPSLPSVEERVKTINALRNFGIEVTIQVSPLLPYGDWQADADNFAAFLFRHADYVHIMPITSKTQAVKNISGLELAKMLAQDRKFHWLRADAANPLITELEKIAPQKLLIPERLFQKDRQLGIFAA
jgi:DNA repair photolyase